MVNNLLLAAWPHDGKIVHSFRFIGSYIDPVPYDTPATATTLWSSTNSTHFSWTFRCQQCTSWNDGNGGFDPEAVVAVMGYAIASYDGAVPTPSDPNAVILYHENGFGQWAMRVAEAHSADYQDWLDAAPGDGEPTPTSTPTPTVTPTVTPTAIPVPTNVLGEADFIVVGGGAGGLVAADRLSEGGKTVVLVERGPPATYEHGGKIIPKWLEGQELTRFDVPGLCNEIWVDSAGVACPDIGHMAGCVLGGGTAVNAGMYFVPPTRDWDTNWPAGWKANDTASASSKLFARIPGTDTPSMDGKRYIQETYGAVGGAVKKAGWKELASINKAPNEKTKTFGPSPFMYSNGERGGPLATYLVSSKARSNFKLLMNSNVRRVIRTNGVATGVEVIASNGEGKTGIYKLKEGGSVVLSAGAFGTPRILFRSGIGPKDQLDIVKASVADGKSMIASDKWILSPVGYNVIDHTNTDLVVSHPSIIPYDFYEAYDNPPEADKNAYLGKRAGILASAAPGIPLVMYDSVTVSDGTSRSIQWTARAEGSLGESGKTLITISQYLGTGISSRGRITINSNLAMSSTDLPHLKTKEDIEAIKKGVSNMLAALTLPDTGITLLQPAPGVTADAYVDAYVQNRGSNHWLGSARLGTDDGTKLGGTSGSVVDLNTKVYGTDNIVCYPRHSLSDI